MTEQDRDEICRLVHEEIEAWHRRPRSSPPIPTLRRGIQDGDDNAGKQEVREMGTLVAHAND